MEYVDREKLMDTNLEDSGSQRQGLEKEKNNNGSGSTEREVERRKEERQYTPVIVKRTDEALKHPDDILERAIEEGQEQQERAFWSLLLSAIAAGLYGDVSGYCAKPDAASQPRCFAKACHSVGLSSRFCTLYNEWHTTLHRTYGHGGVSGA